MSSETVSIAHYRVATHWPLLVIATASCGALLQIDSINWAIAACIIALSTSRRGFWLIAVPSLICFTGLERSVFLDQDIQFLSPLNPPFSPDLWMTSFLTRSFAYWIMRGEAKIDRDLLLLVMMLVLLSSLASVMFMITHGGLPFVNKAPLKFIIFVFLSGVIFSEVVHFSLGSIVWRGLIYATTLGVLQRIAILVWFPVKEPGLYAYTGVFITASMIYLVSRSHLANRQRIFNLLFWSTILLLHLSASRTQLALLFFTLIILLFLMSVRFVPILLVLGIISIGLIPFVSGDFVNYLIHKLNFFQALLVLGGEIGDSASVRMSTFLNLIDGSQTDLLNLLLGRGFWGYIDFSSHPDSAIFSAGAFSDHEHALGMYYHLHFFLNEMLFYFGLVGVGVLSILIFGALRTMRNPLEAVLIAYFVFNFMFRLELIVLFPIILWVARRKLAGLKYR